MNQVRGWSPRTRFVYVDMATHANTFYLIGCLSEWVHGHNLTCHGNGFSEVLGGERDATENFSHAYFNSDYGDGWKWYLHNHTHNVQALAPRIAQLINSLTVENDSHLLTVTLRGLYVSLSSAMWCHDYQPYGAWKCDLTRCMDGTWSQRPRPGINIHQDWVRTFVTFGVKAAHMRCPITSNVSVYFGSLNRTSWGQVHIHRLDHWIQFRWSLHYGVLLP